MRTVRSAHTASSFGALAPGRLTMRWSGRGTHKVPASRRFQRAAQRERYAPVVYLAFDHKHAR